jgi:hypothetical protein
MRFRVEAVDEYIQQDNPVRVIDVFVDASYQFFGVICQ